MRDGIKQARAALRRGDPDTALVLLWNELEPARLEGDQRSLRAIADLAATIAETGDEAQGAEAQRLLEEVQGAAEEGDATAAFEGEARPAGYEPAEEEVESEPSQAASRLAGLVWLVILLIVIAFNLLTGRD